MDSRGYRVKRGYDLDVDGLDSACAVIANETLNQTGSRGWGLRLQLV